jgi:hypothetical protein
MANNVFHSIKTELFDQQNNCQLFKEGTVPFHLLCLLNTTTEGLAITVSSLECTAA